ncbi:MAG: hypothetical protein NC914_00055 [Candidatus Omnitrophica bacterium]|nr:hypothetical protein [Candidatus Omnitrophota bacterium]
MFLKFKKAQAFSEYALFLGIILAAFMVMQHYLRDSVAGKLKAGADYMLKGGESGDGLAADLFDPLASKNVDAYSKVSGGHANYQDGAFGQSSQLEISEQNATQTWGQF